MQQEQPQYYRAVKASERPEENDLYHVILEQTETNAQVKGVSSWNKDAQKWSKSSVVEWLEPIPIPDAEQLREVLSRLYKQVTMGAGVSVKMLSETEEALSAVGDGWVRCEDEKKESMKWWNDLTVNERQHIRWVYGTPGEGYLSENNIIELWKVKQNINR